MRITYIGSLPAIEIDHGGTTTHARHGETIEVSVAVGEELCARKEFQRAAAHPESRNPQPASTKPN
jgi:hypothetical protein